MLFAEHGRHPTSAAYHRHASPVRERGISSAGAGGSQTTLGRPFGGLPNAIAGRTWDNILGPLERYLGMGPQAGSRAAARQESRLGGATGPLANLIGQFRGFEAGVFPQAQQVGSEVSARGSQAFTTLQSMIDDALKNLPQFQTEAAQAGQYASRYATEAFSPVANEDLFQTALRRSESALRPQEAAAGTLGTGAGAQSIQDMIQNLAFQFGGLQDQQRQSAVGMLGNAAAGGANILGAGPAIAGAGMAAIPQLAQSLAAQWGIPMEVMQNLIGMVTGAVAPATQLTAATSPVPLSSSSYWNF